MIPCRDGPPAFGRLQVNEEELKKRLEMLRIEHRDLDAAIDALGTAGVSDQLQDQIAMIEDYLIPDIIA
jgi:hypothetical protein